MSADCFALWFFAAACNFIEGGGISVEIVARKT
jgi:hypothetical protein